MQKITSFYTIVISLCSLKDGKVLVKIKEIFFFDLSILKVLLTHGENFKVF